MWKVPEKTAGHIVKELDLWMIKDREELWRICQGVVDRHPEEVCRDACLNTFYKTEITIWRIEVIKNQHVNISHERHLKR